MNVRITQLDGKLPNLALMKLSGWHKILGDCVTFSKSIEPDLFEPRHDLVYGSAIFKWSAGKVKMFQDRWPGAVVAGTGTDSNLTVESITGQDFFGMDYDIYPWFKPSIGFTQRGCRLKCSFCVVPGKEGRVREASTISQIWRGAGHPKKLHLLDNDFFGQPHWRARCDEILEGDFSVCLNQGINTRLIHREGAQVLAQMKYSDDQFTRRRLYTAWDNRKDEEIFMRGINLLMEAGIRPRAIMVYFLCGYWPGETMEDIFYRFDKMKAMGLMPYPMVYDNSNILMKKFQRWVIRRYHEIVPWEEYQQKPSEDENELFNHAKTQ